MADNSILNIGNWKEDVSFTYDEFNRSMNDDANRSSYDFLCYQILNKMGANVSQYKDVCMKLMRNLKRYNPHSNYFDPKPERCNILYNWIYNLIQKEKVTKDIIKNCFEEYINYKKDIKNYKICDYFSYIEQFEKPMNIILLDIFDSNTEIIRKELIRDYNLTKFPLKKFLCESLKIFKDMKEAYCNRSEVNEKHTKTCTKLVNFEGSYRVFRTYIRDLYPKTLDLDDINNGLFDQCSSDEQKSVLDSDQGKNSCHAKEKGMTASVKISGNFLHGVFPTFPADAGNILQEVRPTPGNEDNSMKKTITTTVGTVAGASSLLALLYRFSPGRNWMQSGIRGSRGRINSNFYGEGPNELLFNGMDHNDFNSYNIAYETI